MRCQNHNLKQRQQMTVQNLQSAGSTHWLLSTCAMQDSQDHVLFPASPQRGKTQSRHYTVVYVINHQKPAWPLPEATRSHPLKLTGREFIVFLAWKAEQMPAVSHKFQVCNIWWRYIALSCQTRGFVLIIPKLETRKNSISFFVPFMLSRSCIW